MKTGTKKNPPPRRDETRLYLMHEGLCCADMAIDATDIEGGLGKKVSELTALATKSERVSRDLIEHREVLFTVFLDEKEIGEAAVQASFNLWFNQTVVTPPQHAPIAEPVQYQEPDADEAILILSETELDENPVAAAQASEEARKQEREREIERQRQAELNRL